MNAAAAQDAQPLVGIIMGSQSDWATLETAMQPICVYLNMQKLHVIAVFK